MRIAETVNLWKEVEKYSRIVSREEVAKNDFNISPSRYIHTGQADEYRPIAEIVDELETLDQEAAETSLKPEENTSSTYNVGHGYQQFSNRREIIQTTGLGLRF